MSNIYRKPASVKICSYCYSQNRLDVSGFSSIRLEAWFCHKYCHNLALLTTGDTRQSDNPLYYKHLIESREKVFPKNMIQNNRKWLRDDIRNKYIKVIKHIFEQQAPEENNRVNNRVEE